MDEHCNVEIEPSSPGTYVHVRIGTLWIPLATAVRCYHRDDVFPPSFLVGWWRREEY